jgi:hypothetical protein
VLNNASHVRGELAPRLGRRTHRYEGSCAVASGLRVRLR